MCIDCAHCDANGSEETKCLPRRRKSEHKQSIGKHIQTETGTGVGRETVHRCFEISKKERKKRTQRKKDKSIALSGAHGEASFFFSKQIEAIDLILIYDRCSCLFKGTGELCFGCRSFTFYCVWLRFYLSSRFMRCARSGVITLGMRAFFLEIMKLSFRNANSRYYIRVVKRSDVDLFILKPNASRS